MSRAQWLVYGSSLAMASCTGSAKTQPSQATDATAQSEVDAHPGEAGRAQDAANLDMDVTADVDGDASGDSGVDVDAKADIETSVVDGPPDGRPHDAEIAEAATPWDGALTPGTGRFWCPPFAGDAAAGDAAGTCDRGTQWCYSGSGPFAFFYHCRSLADTGDAAASFAGGISLDAAACGPGYLRCSCVTSTCGTCSHDDAGGLTVTCGSCYGAPPARLERLMHSPAVA